MRRIIADYSGAAGRWSAYREGLPMVYFGKEFSMEALCRLLDGKSMRAGDVELQIDRIGGVPMLSGRGLVANVRIAAEWNSRIC